MKYINDNNDDNNNDKYDNNYIIISMAMISSQYQTFNFMTASDIIITIHYII